MSSIGLSDNGWTSDFHCLQWLKDSFINQAEARNTSSKPILLVYDGHGSHEKLDLLKLAKDHNIILFSLPPHTTHMLQPLDVGVFGPFARAWSKRCNDYIAEYMQEIPRDQFVKHYMETRQQTFKDTTIRAAFQKSGIWPINHDLFTDVDYAPSISTSSTARDVPDTYPICVGDEDSCQSSSDESPVRQSNVNCHNESSDDEIIESDTESGEILTRPAESVTAVPIPPSRFYSKVPATTRRGQDTEAYILELEKEVSALRRENVELATHATLAFDHVRGLKHHLNVKAPSSKRQKLNTNSRWLNSEEGLAEAERQEAEEKEKAAEKQARSDQRQAEEKERQRQREHRNPNEPFVGALNSRKKAELQDIAYALGLDINGRVDDLKSKINTHFEQHEELCTSAHYIGLFPQLSRQARQVPSTSTSTLPQSLQNITNSMPPPNDTNQYNQALDDHPLTFNTRTNLAHILSQPPIFPSTRRPPGPHNWPSGLVPPGYIVHNPSYYNDTNAYNQ